MFYSYCLTKLDVKIIGFRTKFDCISREIICDEDNQLLREQLESARNELKNSHNLLDDTHKTVTLNEKLAEEKTHQNEVEKQTRFVIFSDREK